MRRPIPPVTSVDGVASALSAILAMLATLRAGSRLARRASGGGSVGLMAGPRILGPARGRPGGTDAAAFDASPLWEHTEAFRRAVLLGLTEPGGGDGGQLFPLVSRGEVGRGPRLPRSFSGQYACDAHLSLCLTRVIGTEVSAQFLRPLNVTTTVASSAGGVALAVRREGGAGGIGTRTKGGSEGRVWWRSSHAADAEDELGTRATEGRFRQPEPRC